MSLKISNRATPKQIIMLKDLDYDGKWDLSTDEAAAIIAELWEQRRMTLNAEQDDIAEQQGMDRYGRPLNDFTQGHADNMDIY